MSYTNNVNSTNIARDGYYAALAKKLREEDTFKSFRKDARKAYNNLKADKEKTEAEIKEIANTYIQSKAVLKIAGCRGSHQGEVEAAKINLHQRLKDVLDAKREQLEKYTLTPPSADMLSLLQTMTLRKGKLSNSELNMLIKKAANNYQALQVVNGLCEEQGLSFVMPFNPEDRENDLNKMESILNDVIEQIDSDNPSRFAFELYERDEDKQGFFSSSFENLDNDTALATEAPELTLIERLEKFKEEKLESAANTGDTADYRDALKASKILGADDISTKEEKEKRKVNAARAEAEALINGEV